MKSAVKKTGLGLAAGIALLSNSYAVPITYLDAGNSGINPTTYSFTATGSGDVTAYFAGSSAGYGSVIGMSVNNSIPSVFGLQNHSSAYGASLNMGHVNTGDTVTFVLLASYSYYGPGPINYVWSSKANDNMDHLNHIYSYAYAGDNLIPAGTYIGFEDLPGLGDKDYNDHQFVFSGPFRETNPNTPNVPEAGSTLAFLGASTLGALAVRRRMK